LISLFAPIKNSDLNSEWQLALRHAGLVFHLMAASFPSRHSGLDAELQSKKAGGRAMML